MIHKRLLGICLLLLPALARAVYAPIPEQEQGQPFVVTLQASAYYDTNIFGAATDRIDSMVYSIAPKLSFDVSVDKQTFFSASYQPTVDYIENRPTDKTLLSHSLALRLARAFSDATNIDLDEAFHVDRNPQSQLNGVALNTDQSVTWNELDARFTTVVGPKTGMALKYRNIYYSYDDQGLGDSLDRMEHLGGVELNYKVLPEAAVVGEYRYQIINYRVTGTGKDKDSSFVLTGVDYSLGKKITLSGRVGLEERSPQDESSTSSPYAEATFRYSYSDQSFVSAGYSYSLEETDDPLHYTDSRTNRFFVNVQHALTPSFIASASATVAPGTLLGIPGVANNVQETSTRLGAALTYVVRKNLSVSATYDYDNVSSDKAYREQLRSRVGINASLYF
jgi:predicted porin